MARHTRSVVGLTGTAAVLAAAGGATWFYANRVTEPPHARAVLPFEHDRVVVETVSGHQLTLRGGEADRPGWWGVAWDGGYARVGPPGDRRGDAVERPVELLHGIPSSGPALLDAWAAPSDPAALGVPVEEIVLDGPVGRLPCWWFHGPDGDEGATWAILVHGRSGSRVETFRYLGPLHRSGLPALAVSYRNDPDGPPSPDGRSHLGATEWADVEAAVAWALEHGARDVVLVGLSMGGAVATELLRQSPLGANVRGLVLEAPVLHWGPVLRRAAVARGLPTAVLPLLLPPTMALAGARARIDWHSLGSLSELGDRPILLIHGADDAVVPVELADALAATSPGNLTYLRVAGAGHVRSWNIDRSEVEAAITRYLADAGLARGRGRRVT